MEEFNNELTEKSIEGFLEKFKTKPEKTLAVIHERTPVEISARTSGGIFVETSASTFKDIHVVFSVRIFEILEIF